MLILLTRCKLFITSVFVNIPIIMILIQDGRGGQTGARGQEGEGRKLAGWGGAGNERWVVGGLNLM